MATNVLDINPLEHLTSDIAKSQINYESILNGLVDWNNSKDDIVTIRLATTSKPWFRDINLHTRYYYQKNSGVTISEKVLNPDKFAYNSRGKMAAVVGDSVVLRVNVVDNGGVGSWLMYKDATLYDEIAKTDEPTYFGYYQIGEQTVFSNSLVEGNLIRYSYESSGKGNIKLCIVKENVAAGDSITSSKIKDVVYVLNNANGVVPNAHQDDMLILFENTVYIKSNSVGEVDHSKSITKLVSGYEPYCGVYHYGDKEYSYGDYVYYGGEFFVYVNDVSIDIRPYEEDTVERSGSQVVIRKYNSNYWKSVLLLPTKFSIKGSGSIRFVLETDVNGFVLKNNSNSVSDDKTEINMIGSIKLDGGVTPEHSGLDVFCTSNYAEWPMPTSKWVKGASYKTEAEKNAYSLQQYSAVMVFNHADPNVKKRNIINYDGPDLDQGLCIMLPCEVDVDENGATVVKKPSDGMMFEFVLNIWPNHDYDGREYNDLIINKSQVYVYNVKNWSDYKTQGIGISTVTPIAKFSMARLTNFYVHDENVGVPDRPVVYKASFIYSEAESRWKTYDYYQFPDHILLSPFGFVDPMSKEAYEVQSAGFPLFQNPFSDYNLTPIHVSDRYRNQIQEDPRNQ